MKAKMMYGVVYCSLILKQYNMKLKTVLSLYFQEEFRVKLHAYRKNL
jgi:hypothetical protein